MTQTSSSMTKVTLTPKGINRVGSIFSDTVSRCKSPFILYIIAMVIFGPLAAIIDYVSIFRQLNEQGFHGPLIMMPFYHENDLARHLDGLRRDMRYFKACEQAARGGEAR